MILQELSRLYDRLAATPGADVPMQGMSIQGIGFRITLTPEGKLVGIDEMRVTPEGKKNLVSVPLQVLGGGERSGSGFTPSFLWDNCGYLLGCKGSTDEKPERTRKAFEALRDKHLAMEQSVNDPSFSAVCRFLESWNPDDTPQHISDEKQFLCNGVFRIQGETLHVHEIPAIRDWWLKCGGQDAWKGNEAGSEQDAPESGMCLVSGQTAPLAKLHEPAIKGVRNAQMSGAKLVSYNCPSFTSYGKEQSFNAPVSEDRAFAYCCGLNYLLARKDTRLFMADATFVFWADAPLAQMDEMMAGFMAAILPPQGPGQESIPAAPMDSTVQQRVRFLLGKLAKGELSHDNVSHGDIRFFILGLSPNATRLSIRFWSQSTFGDLMTAIQNHYRDMHLQRQWTENNSKRPDPELPAPYAVLRETVRDPKDVLPLLEGAYMKAIFNNTPYPDALAQAILRRIKADRTISYIRCSALKAWLTRRQRQSTQHKPITPMLDLDNTEPGYLQGRLFAVYVKTQEDAFRPRVLNTTIRDSYYAAASATPLFVMSRLGRLYTHHLGKLSHPEKVSREKLVQEIESKIDLKHLPRFLNLEQQAYFNLGYYHQMNDFYNGKNKPANQQPTESTNDEQD